MRCLQLSLFVKKHNIVFEKKNKLYPVQTLTFFMMKYNKIRRYELDCMLQTHNMG